MNMELIEHLELRGIPNPSTNISIEFNYECVEQLNDDQKEALLEYARGIILSFTKSIQIALNKYAYRLKHFSDFK